MYMIYYYNFRYIACQHFATKFAFVIVADNMRLLRKYGGSGNVASFSCHKPQALFSMLLVRIYTQMVDVLRYKRSKPVGNCHPCVNFT